MRTSPLLGRKAWFAPRWFGWGWAPVTAEGWVVFAVWFVVTIAVVEQAPAPGWATGLAMPALLLGICWLKGTRPGSAGSRAEFERQGRAPLVHGGGDHSPHVADILENWEQRSAQELPTRAFNRAWDDAAHGAASADLDGDDRGARPSADG